MYALISVCLLAAVEKYKASEKPCWLSCKSGNSWDNGRSQDWAVTLTYSHSHCVFICFSHINTFSSHSVGLELQWADSALPCQAAQPAFPHTQSKFLSDSHYWKTFCLYVIVLALTLWTRLGICFNFLISAHLCPSYFYALFGYIPWNSKIT